MVVKLFILGRPGSGKSSAARHIVKLARRYNRCAIRVNDYDILREMCKADQEGKQFNPIKGQPGFDVIDFSVLDIALKKAEVKARKAKHDAEIVVIEFARDNYIEALRNFRSSFLKDAYFIFIDTKVDICIQRIHKRVAFPTTPDDSFVSDAILSNYYKKQVIPKRLQEQFESEFAVIERRVWFINNSGTRHQFDMEINRIFYSILNTERNKSRLATVQNFATMVYKPVKKVLDLVYMSTAKA